MVLQSVQRFSCSALSKLRTREQLGIARDVGLRSQQLCSRGRAQTPQTREYLLKSG